MRWRGFATSVVCALGAVALAGCATPGYNGSSLESQLVRAGATAAQARCITTALTDTFDVNQLGSHSAPTAKELTTTRGILSKCGVKLALQPR